MSIKELSIAKNRLTDVSAEKIAEFLLFEGNSLKALNLHWNKIKYKGGIQIAKAMEKNNVLKVLDMSWNVIGRCDHKMLA